MTPIFFADPSLFRKWLEENHQKETEIQVGYYKLSARKPTMTWSESVDQALCFGWIDGVRYSIDSESYKIRFTPRKKTSIWSLVNIKKVEHLIKSGLMHPAGLDVFNSRNEIKSGSYSFEQEEIKLSEEFEKKFKKNKIAWKYFEALPKTYRNPSMHWVMSAKQESTRQKRLEELMKDSENGTNKWKHNKYKK